MTLDSAMYKELSDFITWQKLVSVVVLVVVGTPLVRFARNVIHTFYSPLRVIPGPENPHFLFGHMAAIQATNGGLWHEQTAQKYGHVVKYKSFFWTDRLFTTDPKAMNYILNNNQIYQKPDQSRWLLKSILGEGLLFVEGAVHKRQRRVLNPPFGISNIREMTSTFVAKSGELRDALMARLTSEADANNRVRVDMLSYLSRTTLDIIGLTGFNYSFNALSNEEDGLAKSFQAIFQTTGGFPVAQIFKAQFPILRPILRFDYMTKSTEDVEKRMKEIGYRLIAEKKEEMRQQSSEGSPLDGTKSNDLLSLMILSSLNEKEDSGKTLSDEEVLHQIPTFLLAGHETTSTSTTWTILSLAEHPEIQKKLRSELLMLDTESPSMEDLNSLPYLDAVVRESLRYHSVVSGTLRVASQDDVIPLEKPFTDKSGNLRDCIPISKGDTIFIPIRWFNRTTSIWGEDAKSFNPDRWKAVPKDTYAIPGVWGNQLTFLGGPRACIGYRFALVEMKALLFFLVRNFEFELAVPAEDITRRPGVVTRPAVKSELSKGNQLPMFIRAASRDV